MRVTEKIIYDQMQSSIMNTRSRLFRIQQQIAENRKLLRPSDDPRGAEKLTSTTAAKADNDQFLRNITSGKSYLEMTESSLAEAGDLLLRAKEIAIQFSDASYTPADRATASAEVAQLYNRMLGVANMKLGPEYLFSGFRSDRPAYDAGGVYQGDNGVKEIRIGQSEKIALNLAGIDVFGSGATGILRDLMALRDALVANDVEGVKAGLQTMDQGMQTVFRYRALTGARVKGLELQEATLKNTGNALAGQISDLRDLDLAEAATNLTRQEAAYEAAIQVSGRIASMTSLNTVTIS